MEVTKDLLQRMYWDKELSIAEIVLLIGGSEETIRRHMVALGIPRRRQTWKCAGWNKGGTLPDTQRKAVSETRKAMYATGQLLHWNKGQHWSADVRLKISASLLNGREPAGSNYGHEWRMQRTSCLQRDNYTCQQCAATDGLEVHHWEPYRFSFDNSLENLVTLCAGCHRDTHEMYRREGFIAEAEEAMYA
jgi:hypothetical protein